MFLYALIPVLLAVHWFGLAGGLAAAGGATTLFVAGSFAPGSERLAGGDLWLATVNRAVVFVGWRCW